MYAPGLTFLLVQAWALTGTISYLAHHELTRKNLHSNSEPFQLFRHDNNTGENEHPLATLYRTPSPDEGITPQRTATPENYWQHTEGTNNIQQMRPAQTNSFIYSFGNKENRQNIFERTGRFKRETNKFTGLVVGALKDTKLKQSVKDKLTQVETLIWSSQSQYTKPFIPGSHTSSVILGTFHSEFRTNYHGPDSLVQVRRSNDYSIQDLNALNTLLILQCLIEASLYGSATTPAVSNMSLAVESLKAFYTHSYPRGSSILTMWPEKLLTDNKGWVNLPENIRGIPVKENTTYNQLQQFAKSCNCESAKTGLKEMSENRLCKDHFNTPLSELFNDTATPPDFLTSFANLALGSLLQAKFPTKNNGIYKAESELWLSANSDLKILINKLKSMVIFYPPTTVKETRNVNIDDNLSNVTDYFMDKIITSDGKEADKNITYQNVTFQDVTSQNVTSMDITADINVNSRTPTLVENVDLGNELNRTARSVSLTSEVSFNDSSEPENTTGDVERRLLTSNIPTTPATFNASSTTNATFNKSVILSATPFAAPTPTTSVTAAAVASTSGSIVSPTIAATQMAVSTESLDPKRNQILSSESYYAIRNYLDTVIPEAQAEVILIPSLISEDVKTLDGNIWHNGKLYHNYNTVNLMTSATTVHALIVASMSGLIDIRGDVILQRIVVSSLRVLTWYMNNTHELVTMVTLSEFPSRFQLYWATSRIAFQLNSNQAKATKLFQFAEKEKSAFLSALRDRMTFSILQSITDAGLGQDGKTRVYIDDFIGAADVDNKGKKLVGGDDRLFSSAMAINALIATWTVQHDNGHLEFVKDIGDPVRIAINSLANYIIGVVDVQSGNNMNAYMSEQIKNCQTMPARYPANVVTTTDGKQTVPKEPRNDLRFGIKGYLTKHDYQSLLDTPQYGYHTRGGSLEDLNSPTSVFRFWSSPAYTKAATLLAIAQAANLQVDGNN